MKQGSTVLLRAAVLAIGLVVLALCVFVLPEGIRTDVVGGYRWILLGMYVTVIPFFIGIYEAMKLLDYIDNNSAFSELSVNALKAIRNCAFTISGMFLAGLPYIYIVAERDDAPGVIVIGMILVAAPFVVAVFAALLQRLLQNAIDIKSENDLTV